MKEEVEVGDFKPEKEVSAESYCINKVIVDYLKVREI